MTPADPLTVLLNRAYRGVPLTPDEAAALRAAVGQLQQQTAYAERRAEQWEQARDAEVLTTARVFDEYYRRWQSTIVQARRQARRAARYRAAWQSARRRARLTRAEQELAALHGQTPQPAEPRTHNSDIWEDEDGWHVSCEHYDCPDSSRDVGSEYDAEEWAEQHRAEATAEDAATRTRDGGSQ